MNLTNEQKAWLRQDIAERRVKRETFGQLKKTKAACERLRGLARAQGWDELRVERVPLHPTCVRFKLTGIPDFMRKLDEMFGRHGSQTNAPRVVNSNRRKGQSYRHGGA